MPKKCVICSRPLDRFFETKRLNSADPILETKPGKVYNDLHYYGLNGYQGNGYFCSQKCGYQYGVQAIKRELVAAV